MNKRISVIATVFTIVSFVVLGIPNIFTNYPMLLDSKYLLIVLAIVSAYLAIQVWRLRDKNDTQNKDLDSQVATISELREQNATQNKDLDSQVATISELREQNATQNKDLDSQVATISELREQNATHNKNLCSKMATISHTTFCLKGALHELQTIFFEYTDELSKSKSVDRAEALKQLYRKNTEKILCDHATSFATTLSKQIQYLIQTQFNAKEKVRVNYKIISACTGKEVRFWKVLNAIWDQDSYYNQQHLAQIKEYEIKDYSALENIIYKEDEIFCFNNLMELKKLGVYRNPSDGWNKRYNAKMILPVWYKGTNSKQKRFDEFYGFLSIDCLNRDSHKIFSNSERSIILAISKIMSNNLSILHSQVTNVEDQLNSYFDVCLNRLKNGIIEDRRLELAS